MTIVQKVPTVGFVSLGCPNDIKYIPVNQATKKPA